MPEKQIITVPFNYMPRRYQMPLYNCLDEGVKRAVAVWHRRSGKDKTFLNMMVGQAWLRVGIYYYFFPTYNQGRKVLWDGIDKAGFPYLGHIPEAIRESTNQAEMKIKLRNGSLIQIVGTDNIDSIMGTNPIGNVFSEYSLQNPVAWDLIRPILAENEGWAIFNFTPRGRNHAFELYNMARADPKWHCELLTVEDTKAISQDTIAQERAEGMSEEMIQQEYFCSFESSLASCFFKGVLEGHKETCRGVYGFVVKVLGREDEFDFQENLSGNLEIWRYPYKLLEDYDYFPWKRRYTIGSDISEGLGGDYSVAYVFDRVKREIVACMRSNRIDSHVWGERLYWLSRYYDNAFIVPERNGAGITTMDRLADLNANLYFRQMVATAGKQATRQYGWLETREAKQHICGLLKSYLAKKIPVYDNGLLQECAAFIKDEDKEKLGADTGFHDDRVIAAALSLQGDVVLEKPWKTKAELTGWRKRMIETQKEGAVWAA